jgi:hypothetical protein
MIPIRIVRGQSIIAISEWVAAVPSIYVSNPVSVNFEAALVHGHIVLLIEPASVLKRALWGH